MSLSFGQDYFTTYVSNTFAGTSNNYILKWGTGKTVTGRLFYKVCEHGTYNYRFLFSNTVDSTFSDGTVSTANMLGGKWRIICAFAGDGGAEIEKFREERWVPVLFNQRTERDVLPGDCFWSDEVKLTIPEEHYLVFQWTIAGDSIPYTPDKLLPSFIEEDGVFKPCVDFPQPQLVACDRNIKKKIAFLGDSITQGIGTRTDFYEFWVAEIGKRLGSDFSVWNLGLGYGRAQDAASNGAWLNKAKQMDVVFVCLGVNDIQQGRSQTQLCEDLLKTVKSLKDSGCSVGIFTIPPFDWEGEHEKIWRYVNQYIKAELSEITDYCFDTVKVLGRTPPKENMARYGGHPDGEGGKALAESFITSINIK